jgi:hypothetical protein
MGRAVDTGTLASALCWAGGAPIPIVHLDTLELPGCTSVGVAISATVHARPRELAIQIDAPGVHRHGVRIAYDASNTLHVLVDRPGDVGPAYRRFDFAGAYDASRSRAWMRYGIVTIRVPASKKPPWVGCPNIATATDAMATAGAEATAARESHGPHRVTSS